MARIDYIPDIKLADETVVSHWGERSRETTNPIMCARYADLVWEFGATYYTEEARSGVRASFR